MGSAIRHLPVRETFLKALRRMEIAMVPTDDAKKPEQPQEETVPQAGNPREQKPEGEALAPERENAKLSEREGRFERLMKEGEFPVVAIGASAGGLQALEAFFEAVPVDSGLAFVVITHTDPEHESLLPELLKKKLRIPVKVIEDGLAAEPNTVYLPPSNRDPILKQKVFFLKQRPAKTEIHMPVDLFLKHLAGDREELAAGVILSGTGTDGTHGLRAIKEKGGLAVAQTPDSARHEGMPKSAIETGMVDYVLPPPQIPERLIQYFKHPAVILPQPGAEEKRLLDPLHRILTVLNSRTRHDFSLYKESTLVRRIERRMTVTRARDALDYARLLNSDPEEARALLQDILIGVTNFFREPEAFAFLKRQILPDLVARGNGEPLRVWVPGCATGEEAYSLAIILQECLEEQGSRRSLQIFGTDIDSLAIRKARLGSYVENIASDVSPERLKRFFIKEESRFRVKPDIRELVVFSEQNILSDPPFAHLDLLLCRNLLIYLKAEAQNLLIPLFHYALREGGVLFLGSSESTGRFGDLFETVDRHHSIFRRKDHVLAPQIQFPMGRRLGGFAKQPKGKEGEPPEANVGRTVANVLLAEHTPACVVVNQNGEILHFHGRTGKYLEPALGSPRWHIGEMAREGLRFPLLSAMRRARAEGGEVREKLVRVKTNGEYQQINLVIKTFKDPPLQDCQMVIFEDVAETPPPAEGEKILRPDDKDGMRMAELEGEILRVTQDYRGAMEELQTSNEELRSSNEELHSSNEELQSTNEELESSREELQSLNEELNTVNSELNSKIEEIHGFYNAINSALKNTRIAIVFLDKELRVKMFTPEATLLLNLLEADVGRPIQHISHNLEYENLVKKAEEVLKNLSEVDEEVRGKDGSWYRLRIMIHRPEPHVIEGVVLTFMNIDAQKKAQEDLQEMSARAVSSAKRFAENIVDTVRESLLVLDRQMRVVTANRGFYETFRSNRNVTEGRSLFELGNRQWDIPQLRKLLEDTVQKDKTFQDYVVEVRFPEIGLKRMLLSGRMLREGEKKEDRILLAIDDMGCDPRVAQKAEK